MQHDDKMRKIGLSSRGAGILAGDLLVHSGGDARGTIDRSRNAGQEKSRR